MLEAGRQIKLVKGEYRLIAHLEHGNQGQVWRVCKTDTKAEYALKTLRIDDDPEICRLRAQRIADEIAFLRQLPDPEAHYIISCLDSGDWRHRDEDFPAFVMPCYPERLSQHDRAPDGSTLLRWAEQLAEALHWLHSHSAGKRTPIHRDLKPKNVLLTPGGDIRLIDFGIVKVSGGTGTLAHRDSDYFAPEQRLAVQAGAYEGEDRVAPTAKSDLYCLGLILFQFAIGRSAVPTAQLRLREDRVRADHLERLKQNGHGLLGEIGGLTSRERSELREAMRGLFSGNTSGTLVFQAGPGLPDHSLVAARLAEWVEALLAPAPEERPSAKQAKAAFAELRQGLSPGIDQISAEAAPAEVIAGQPLRLSVELRGSGLPAHGRWLTLTQDGKPLVLQPRHRGEAEGFLSGHQVWDYSLRSPPDQEAEVLVSVSCRIDDREHRAEAVYRVRMTPEQFWNSGGGNRLEALRRDPRPQWLDEIATEISTAEFQRLLGDLAKEHTGDPKFNQRLAASYWAQGEHERALGLSLREEWLVDLDRGARTFGERMQLLDLLKGLRNPHPGNDRLEQLIHDIENAPVVQPKPRLPDVRPLAYAIGLVLALGVGYWMLTGDVDHSNMSPIADQPQPAEGGQETNQATQVTPVGIKPANSVAANDSAQQTQFPEIPIPKPHSPQSTPPIHDRLAQWVQQNDVASIEAAIPRLSCTTDQADAISCHWLGYLHGRGLGVARDLSGAMRHLARALDRGETEARTSIQELDALADLLLASRDPREREHGYTIAEAAAEAGDINAMIWMAYRYDRGDGVQRDLETAERWYGRAKEAGDEIAAQRLTEL